MFLLVCLLYLFVYQNKKSVQIFDNNNVSHIDIGNGKVLIEGELGANLGTLFKIRGCFKYTTDTLFVTHLNDLPIESNIAYSISDIIPYGLIQNQSDPLIFKSETDNWNWVVRNDQIPSKFQNLFPKPNVGDEWEIMAFESLKTKIFPELPFLSFQYLNNGYNQDSEKRNMQMLRHTIRFSTVLNVVSLKTQP